jgi:D-alanyl-D-alanine carboxypeptidase (penicillin-binding protein 5/6)
MKADSAKERSLFYLALISFVFIASSALALVPKSQQIVSRRVLTSQKIYSPLPTLGEHSNFPIISAQAALAIDLDSGISLYEKEPDKALLPASTTKIITALVSLDNYSEDEVLAVLNPVVDGQKMGLVRGEEIKVIDLLYGLLVYSANDAAEVLAQNYPGGREVFIEAMNAKAKSLSLFNSTFKNPAGLDGNGHTTTARDLIRVSQVAMRNPLFAEIVGTKEKTVESTDGKIAHRLVNINELLGSVDGVLGVKTGWTENARENLVTYLERDGHKIMIALLGSQDRFGETRELIDWIFASYEWEEVVYSP